MTKIIAYHPFFIRLFHWEYWPFHVVYGPIYFYWFWLCLRAKSFFFFNTSNPSIRNGGFLMESKKEIYDLLPEEYYPKTLFFRTGTSAEDILKSMEKKHFEFPVIGKPDIGMKGISVKKLNDKKELKEYAMNSEVDFLVQEFANLKNEVGIFYYRYPDEKYGRISGIVQKEFLTVTGDGKSSIKELLMLDKRFVLQIPALKKMYGEDLNQVLKPWQKKILVPYGNHVRGAKFIDASHLIDERLTITIDSVCKKIKGFYYGRLDIRYDSWNDLREGKNFFVIEVNGAGSEPTHIYDPKHSIFFAWKEIIRHWKILWRISKINRQRTQIPYMNISSGLRMLKENKEYVKMITENKKQTA